MKLLLKYLVAFILFMNSVVSKKCKCMCESENDKMMEPYIIGGNFTTINRFPHSVGMFLYPMVTYFCGGSVLNQKIVLTAAHCVPIHVLEKNKETKIYIMAGHENLENMTTAVMVKDYIYHSEYDEDTVENDIAMLFLGENLQLGSNIKRVIITKMFPNNTQPAYIAGWGTVNDKTRELSLMLKYTSQNVIPLERCQEMYEEDWFPGMMCGGDPKSETNRPSRGDSGSALITSEYHQIGLVSYRNPDEPGLIFYSNVSFFYDWIESNSILACSKPVVDNLNNTINQNLTDVTKT